MPSYCMHYENLPMQYVEFVLFLSTVKIENFIGKKLILILIYVYAHVVVGEILTYKENLPVKCAELIEPG